MVYNKIIIMVYDFSISVYYYMYNCTLNSAALSDKILAIGPVHDIKSLMQRITCFVSLAGTAYERVKRVV